MSNALTASTSITLFGVQCWDEGTREYFGRFSSYAERTLVCRWTDRLTLVGWLTANSVVIGSVVVAAAGAQYPDVPSMRVDHVDITGVPGINDDGTGPLTNNGNGLVSYKYARLKIVYQTLDLGDLGLDFGADIITAPQSGPWLEYADSSGDVPTEDSPPIIMPVTVLTKSLRGLSRLPVSTIIYATQNPMNSASFFGAGAGYALYDGGQSFWRQTSAGQTNYDVTFRFKVRGIPWDYVFPSGGDAPKQVRRKDGAPLFGSSDLNLLLNPV